ncbi:MAG: hypothetical protein ABIQ16_12235 [Polyangiaceae bacterium]
MLPLLLVPAVLQMLAMFLDEFVFHRARGLPKWERVGHPLDTLSAALCFGWLVRTPPDTPHALGVYVTLCAFSCVFITKDEFVHSRLCEPWENWLHAVLFVLHPIVFLAFGVIWQRRLAPWLVTLELVLTLGLLLQQVIYWRYFAREQRRSVLNTGE